jgi:hypothetical protein
VQLRSFWHRFYAHLTTGWTAVVYCYPQDMGALTSLDISKNRLYAEGTKLLAEALKSNQIMTALNISSNSMTFNGKDHTDMSGIAALADAIHGMGALSSLDLCKNNLGDKGAKALAKQLRILLWTRYGTKHALKQAAGRRCAHCDVLTFICDVSVLTPSALTGSNSCSSPPANARARYGCWRR